MPRATNGIVSVFYLVVEEKFEFLEREFGYEREAVETGGGLHAVTYRNGRVGLGVEVGLEWREQHVYVELLRLVGGRRKENPVVITPDSELTVFNLEDLLALRAPREQFGGGRLGEPLTRAHVAHIVVRYAHALREHAGDVLAGDFSVFGELEAIVRSRAAGHPVEAEEFSEGRDVDLAFIMRVVARMDKFGAVVEQGMSFDNAVTEAERRQILRVLRRSDSDIGRAAERLRISRDELRHSLRKIARHSFKHRT